MPYHLGFTCKQVIAIICFDIKLILLRKLRLCERSIVGSVTLRYPPTLNLMYGLRVIHYFFFY